MRVELPNGGGLLVDGMLKGIIEQHGGSYPHMVIELHVSGRPHPVRVSLDEHDLITILTLARGSTVQRIKDAIAHRPNLG